MSSIGVVLNGYRRGHMLEQQLQALDSQTMKPEQVILWYNNPGNSDPNYDVGTKIPTAYCTYNFGVWARFAYALNLQTEYICIFDDDTVPGTKWLENCYNTIQNYDGLLGTIGVKFLDKTRYEHSVRVGWDRPNENVEIVDIVGHSWFFKRSDLSIFWRELPPIGHSTLVGEDMHFSYTLQKYTGKKTYVPPHPLSDREMWGSKPDIAWKVGTDESAISVNPSNMMKMNQALTYYIDNGFTFCTK